MPPVSMILAHPILQQHGLSCIYTPEIFPRNGTFSACAIDQFITKSIKCGLRKLFRFVEIFPACKYRLIHCDYFFRCVRWNLPASLPDLSVYILRRMYMISVSGYPITFLTSCSCWWPLV